MSHYVLISTIYIDKPSANGICAQNLVKALEDSGNSVDVICYHSDEPHKANIYTVPSICNNDEGSLIGKFRSLSRLVYPKFDNTLIDNYLQQLSTINEKRKIDCIIAMYFPFESVEAVYRFKKKYDDVTAIVYELDSVGDGIAQSGIQGWITKSYERWLMRSYLKFDAIFVMKSHEQYWRTVFGKKYIDKLQVADIPVFTRKTTKDSDSCKQKTIKMIYAGLIEKKYRSPSYLLDVLRIMKNDIEYEMQFFSKGDCEEEIQIVANDTGKIIQNGYVEPDVLEYAIQDADFLISIGNSVSRSVPSKIISYLSYGKPIIHFSSQKDDICKQYLQGYGLALIVDQTESVEKSAAIIREFINKNRGKTLPYDTIRKKLYLNNPAYSAKVMSSIVFKNKVGRME